MSFVEFTLSISMILCTVFNLKCELLYFSYTYIFSFVCCVCFVLYIMINTDMFWFKYIILNIANILKALFLFCFAFIFGPQFNNIAQKSVCELIKCIFMSTRSPMVRQTPTQPSHRWIFRDKNPRVYVNGGKSRRNALKH